MTNDTNLGDISLDNNVIKNIALKAATDIQGIRRVKKRLIRKAWDMLTRRDSAYGVKLEFIGDSELKIILRIIVEYGTSIPHAAGEAQEGFKNAVEQMTGLAVAEVAVKIVEIHSRKDVTLKEDK